MTRKHSKVEPKTEAISKEKLIQEQSIAVDGNLAVRRSPLSEKLEATFYDDVTTVYEGFLRGCRTAGESPCLGKRGPQKDSPFQWLTYNEVHEKAHNFGSGLVHLGCEPTQETFIGIFAPNCVEWMVTDLACQMFSMISVPIYDTLGLDACVYIINHADIETIVCHPSKLLILIENASSISNVKRIVLMGDVTEEQQGSKQQQSTIQVVSFCEVEETGKTNKKEKNPPNPDDIYAISYTSGTTGTPKGVIQTHANQVACSAGVLNHYKSADMVLSPADSHLSFLPLAHTYEKLLHTFLLQVGARIGYYRGDIRLLMEDIQELKPTIFAAVPRLLNRIYDKVIGQVSRSWFKSWLFKKALKSKEADLKKNIIRDDTIWDKLVFKKIRLMFGGKMRAMSSGAAPLSANVMMFYKCAMGKCLVMEGYGQTETTAACALQFGHDVTAGHVGAPMVCNHVKLVDVPEQNYFAKDFKGEICVKGPNVTRGYHKQSEKTAELFDDDGWMHTGDIGVFLENGALKITDRIKDIFKLAQGEYVAPGKIQNILLRSPLVAQAFVYGESLKTFLVAIIVPDQEVLVNWAKQKRIEGDVKTLCKTVEVRQAVLEDCLKVSKEAKLNGFEQVKAIHLHYELFSVENGLMTATFKIKRPTVQERFQEEIQCLYDEAENQRNTTQI